MQTICTSFQTITPAPHHSNFYRPDAHPDAKQQYQSTEGIEKDKSEDIFYLPTEVLEQLYKQIGK